MERQKQQHKVGWLNSPNVYVKQELDEIGTQTPKKITKVSIPIPKDWDFMNNADINMCLPVVQKRDAKQFRYVQSLDIENVFAVDEI